MKDKYKIVNNAIDKELANFLYNYFLTKRKVVAKMIGTRYIPSDSIDFGIWNDPQALGSYSIYADIAFETLLPQIQLILEKEIKTKLLPTYSYARLYKKNDVLEKHIDRGSCEISCTLNLGGDNWSIYLEPDIEVNLTPGDMLIYKGAELEHWRDEFKGDNCGQVFLHYCNASNIDAKKLEFDGRPFLGLPQAFIKPYD